MCPENQTTMFKWSDNGINKAGTAQQAIRFTLPEPCHRL